MAEHEEKLISTEQQLIQAKASWANSEHEREQLYNQCQELEERIQELEENLAKAEDQRVLRYGSLATTKTSSSNKSNNAFTVQ